jgi:hypothetical protein
MTMRRLAGRTTKAISESQPWMASIRAAMPPRIMVTTATAGRTPTTISSSRRSVMARVTIWPVARASSRSGSVDWRRS